MLKDAFGSSSEDEGCTSPSAADLSQEPPNRPGQAQLSGPQGFVTFDVRKHSNIGRKTANQQEGDKRAGIKVLLPENSAIVDEGRTKLSYIKICLLLPSITHLVVASFRQQFNYGILRMS